MIPKDFLRDIYPTADEETKLNIKSWIFGFIEDDPSIEQEIAGRAIRATALDEARDAVKGNLRERKLDVRPEHVSRIDGCTSLDTLHRWRNAAVTAATVEEALGVD